MFKRFSFLVIFILSCCGYTTRSILPTNIKSIAIPVATNETVKPGLAEALTEQLINDFTQDRTLKIDNVDRASIILDCAIKNYERSPQSYTANQEVIAWKIVLEASAKTTDRAKSEQLWQDNVSISITYDDKTETEDQGIDKAIKKLSQEILRKVLTSW
jgi:hypothetical protein